jgi:hypothetical protein
VAQSTPHDVALADLVNLYKVEAGLIQQKLNQILSIRSLAITVLAAAAVGSRIYPHQGLVLVVLALIPFYLLDFVYDAYLIPIVERETELRSCITKWLSGNEATLELARLFANSVGHRIMPKSWNPFLRAALEVTRVTFYVALTAAFFLASLL